MDTKISLVEKGCTDRVGALFVEAFNHNSALLVADENTLSVAGFAVTRSLEQQNIVVRQCCFPAEPQVYADEHSIEIVRNSLSMDNSIIVVLGSGSLNDIAKRASFELERPYMVVATAPSVDGYTSYGAAVSIQGFKQTLPCNAPYAVVADTDILCSAPMPMIASGFGDCMAKFTAGADWILADTLGIQPIRKDIWDMVQNPLHQVYARAEKIGSRDRAAIGTLFEALSASGFAMQIMHDSRPASGSEHLISHIWEMEHLCKDGLPVSHGFKVAVGTIAISFLYDKLQSMDFSSILDNKMETWEERKDYIRNFFPSDNLFNQVLPLAKAKFLTGDELLERRKAILKSFKEIKTRCSEQLPGYEKLSLAMQTVSCPTMVSEINANKEDLVRAIKGAQIIRNRYTILDLLYEVGLLDEALLALEGLAI
ncbi:sn-glycerol-1-phosphate dehydrogenase [uncultured Sphaerochaeta sp.]|uniref:sn-glycerol-1-phosphate dehydrogenase n=1 Tax=uncultured Sphaerochaeta sp. TaxID=886478 RepID=UPI002A0A447D|nr:sn-glycerol-1-phosphate dehydrogenase [uncultured Sphaerochaeta sp.]